MADLREKFLIRTKLALSSHKSALLLENLLNMYCDGMKVVACLPFRNESRFLPNYMSSMEDFADEVVGFDHDSTDKSAEIFRKLGGFLITTPNLGSWASGGENEVRQKLLDVGREIGGTHFIWLDADEALVSDGSGFLKQSIDNLEPGQKLALRWFTLWRDTNSFRRRWVLGDPPYKDFVHCDDGISQSHSGYMHMGRTPGPNKKGVITKIPVSRGAVLHYQFLAWKRSQLKQTLYKVAEFVVEGRDFHRINLRYRDTSRLRFGHLRNLPPRWQTCQETDLVGSEIDDRAAVELLTSEIQLFFQQAGIEKFEKLDIWDLDDLREMFVAETGRLPKPWKPTPITCIAADAVDRLRS